MFSDHIAIRRNPGDTEGEKFVSVGLYDTALRTKMERLADIFLSKAMRCENVGDEEGARRYNEMRTEVLDMME